MRKTLVGTASLAMVVFAAACGGGDSSSSSSPAPASDTSAPAASGPATGTAGVKGSVAFEGQAPEPKKIAMSADQQCAAKHDGPVYDEVVTVNDNGTLKDVFIYVKEGLEGRSYPTPSEPVILDQKGCKYAPHVIGMQTDQTMKILNSDGLLHNVHALPTDNSQFNVAMPQYMKEIERTFENPEVMIRVKCEVHPWMGAWIGVLEHPYFSVTDDTGSFSIEGLPAGDYTIEAWHEKYGQSTQQVTVADGEVKDLAFTFSGN